MVLDLWIPFDMVMMWVEVLLSVGAQCDQVANLKVYVRKCKFSLSYCYDGVSEWNSSWTMDLTDNFSSMH